MKPGDFVKCISPLEYGYIGVIKEKTTKWTNDWMVEIFFIPHGTGNDHQPPPIHLSYEEAHLKVIRTAEEVAEFLEGYL